MLNRRSLITGLISLVAAPAIVRASNLMPVKKYGGIITPNGGRISICMTPGQSAWVDIGDGITLHPGDPIALDWTPHEARLA